MKIQLMYFIQREIIITISLLVAPVTLLANPNPISKKRCAKNDMQKEVCKENVCKKRYVKICKKRYAKRMYAKRGM
jgi:hypothetical protein